MEAFNAVRQQREEVLAVEVVAVDEFAFVPARREVMDRTRVLDFPISRPVPDLPLQSAVRPHGAANGAAERRPCQAFRTPLADRCPGRNEWPVLPCPQLAGFQVTTEVMTAPYQFLETVLGVYLADFLHSSTKTSTMQNGGVKCQRV